MLVFKAYSDFLNEIKLLVNNYNWYISGFLGRDFDTMGITFRPRRVDLTQKEIEIICSKYLNNIIEVDGMTYSCKIIKLKNDNAILQLDIV